MTGGDAGQQPEAALADVWADHTGRRYGIVRAVERNEAGMLVTYAQPGGEEVQLLLRPAEGRTYPVFVGDMLTVWSWGAGTMVRGVATGDLVLFYQSEADARAAQQRVLVEAKAAERLEYERHGKAAHDAIAATWEPEWQARLQFLRGQGADDWWFHEGYEVRCITQARLLVQRLETAAEVERVWQLPHDERVALLGDAWMPGHSGNSEAFAYRLAALALTQPAVLWKEHAAMCPVVGCDATGCYARDHQPRSMSEGVPHGTLVEPHKVAHTRPRWIGEG
jgi:hypothetical protein